MGIKWSQAKDETWADHIKDWKTPRSVFAKWNFLNTVRRDLTDGLNSAVPSGPIKTNYRSLGSVIPRVLSSSNVLARLWLCSGAISQRSSGLLDGER